MENLDPELLNYILKHPYFGLLLGKKFSLNILSWLFLQLFWSLSHLFSSITFRTTPFAYYKVLRH